MGARTISAAAFAVALIGITGCGGSPTATRAVGTTTSAVPAATTPVAARTASCAPTVRASPPAGFPSSVPLPAGTVLTSSETRSDQRLVVDGTVPREFEAVLAELQAAYPRAGFPLAAGEVEKDDAESNFSGNGYTGRWAIRAVEGCQATTVSVVIQKSG